MKSTLKMIISLAGLALLATPAIRAQSEDAPPPPPRQGGKAGGPRGPRGGPNAEMLAQRLGLSDQQKSQVTEIMKHEREQMEALRDDVSMSPEDKRAKMRSIREEGHKSIEAILTDEQKKKFAEMGPPKGGRRGEGGGKRPKPQDN